MLEPKRAVLQKQAGRTLEALRKNNMGAQYVPTAKEAADKVLALLHEGDTVAVGGSETLAQLGIIDRLRQGAYRFLDRYAPGLDDAGRRRIFLESFDADAYLLSANAITMQGELYNVDGRGNRVSALIYGPRRVIVVAGINKIVPDLDAAVSYVKRVSAPANAKRLNCDTPCAASGVCAGLRAGRVTAGCASDDRICCSYVVSAMQREPGRIQVILVGEELGY